MLAGDSSQHSLYLKRIVVENFKSYFGRHNVGDFHPDFTSIVGSNGSGKSNIIDSLLFVFGFRSNYLRHSKLSNLIYSGHVQCQFCIVELHFLKENVESFVISRKVDVNNTSTYYINNKATPFKQVKDLVMSWGIDLEHNRFMILQGEIESIAQMKPTGNSAVAGIPNPERKSVGLLEYLEDIIGTTHLHLPLYESFNKVQECDELKEQYSRQVNHAQKDRDELLPAFEEANSYIRKHNDKTELQSMVYQQQKMLTLEQIEQCRVNMDKITLDIEALQQVKLNLKSDLESIHSEMQQYISAHSTNEKKTSALRSTIDSLEKQVILIENDIQHAKQSIQRKLKATNTNDEKLNNLVFVDDSSILALESEIKSIEFNLSAATKEMSVLRLKIKSKLEPIEAECDTIQHALNPINKQIASVKTEMQTVIKQQSQLKSKQQEVSSNNLVEALENKKQEIDYINPEINKQIVSVQQLQSELNNLEVQVAERVNEMESISSKIEFGKSEESLKLSTDKTSTHIYKLKSKINGIRGKLGDLGTIDPKYDVAVSTAAPSLHNFVVESVDDANKCVNYLRENRLNRTTFIVLDKIKNNKINETNGNTRLIDLISCPDDLKCAFYHAVRDTIVATDIDEARKLSKSNRYCRIVTLDGKMIEPSGVMSGGGNKSYSGALNTSSVPLGNSYSNRNTDIESSDRELAKLKSVIAKLNQQIVNKQSEIESSSIALKDMQDVHKELIAEYNSLEQMDSWTAEDDQLLKSLEIQRTELYKKLQSLNLQTEPLISKLQAQKSLLQVTGGDDLELKQVRVESLQKDLSSMQQRSQQAKKDALIYKEAYARLNKESLKLIKDLKGLEKTVLDNTTKLSKLQIESKTKREELLLFEQEFIKRDKELQEYKNNIKLKEEELNSSKNNLMTTSNNLDDVKRQGRALESQLSKIELEMTKLALHGDEEFKIYSGEQLDAVDTNKLNKEIKHLEQQLDKMNPNLSALKQFQLRQEQLDEKIKVLDKCKEEQEKCRLEFDNLKATRTSTFMHGFNIISKKLKEIYCLLTMGGNAELEFVDSLDPFSEGIQFSVMPPKKSWKLISNLSGGEKTLSSLALVYALHHFKPCPIYVMDEIGKIH
eukprot:NODE_242_length_13076_cov_0.518379.p1 type:complete len:1115 gc:universal NODE_242_length_13076_cov_0.518379:353-3697(+)